MPPASLLALLATLDSTIAAPVAPAAAEEDADVFSGEDPLPRRGVLPVLAGVVPGLVVHGTGHFVAGDRQGAQRLLATESVGLGLFATGVAGLSFTGASRRYALPFEVATIAGVGTMALTMMASLYGVTTPPGGLGRATPATPSWQGSLSTLYLRNPISPYHWVSGAEVEAWVKKLRFGAQGWTTPDRDTVRVGLHGAHRWRGPRPHGAGSSRDSAILDLLVATLHHREQRGIVPFDFTNVEVALGGRFGLARHVRSLAGSFVEWAGGLGVSAYHYGGVASSTEYNESLLLHFGYGFYLGSGAAPHGEALISYDHHHDDFVGGVKMPGLGSGPAGSFGVEVRGFVTRHLGLGLSARFGSAHLYGLSLRWRAGGGS